MRNGKKERTASLPPGRGRVGEGGRTGGGRVRIASTLLIALLLALPARAADPFYESLLRDGTHAYDRGDFAEARRIHYRLLRLMNLNFVESSPVPVKASLAILGLCEESYRLPLCPPTEATREALRAALKDLELR